MSDISDRFSETLPCGCEFFTGQWFLCELHQALPLHSQHTTPVRGCLDCEDGLEEARELEGQQPWFDGDAA